MATRLCSLILPHGLTSRQARHLTYFAATFLLVSLFNILLWYKEDTLCRLSFNRRICTTQTQTSLLPPATYNVVVASTFPHHFDVYLALVWSFERVMKGRGSLQVYAPSPFYYDFQTVVDDLGLYHGSVKNPQNLIHDIESTAIDMIILGTCEVDIPNLQDRLLAAWDARDNGHKFQLVCIAHDRNDRRWQTHITPWAKRNTFRLLTLSEHVSSSFWTKFKSISTSIDPVLRSSGYTMIPIDSHIPIVNLTGLPDKFGRRILSSAVIQGSFSQDRRAYNDIFKDLNRSLHESPESWGYLPLGDGLSYIPDNNLVDPPFKLYLVGSGSLDLPPELKNVVVLHVNLNYREYYDIMGEIDICVPAFGPSDRYYVEQASATTHTCLETNNQMLVTLRHREAYTYLDDDQVTVTYPAVMTEIDAIRALRTRNTSAFLESDPSGSGITLGSNVAVRRAVEEMVAKGWVRTKRGFEDRKRKIWAENEVVVSKLLHDLQYP